ncbi:uncharacterized protein A4U43_C02F20760 [Asparagus officinalis]|uniref:Uncharacterized protein n=1 Tax=Asparagus officinalis TaxID=4686 RepID=A0A5P1FKM7_ASPOF|nr:uncharacterized protein A4U43_C02F20760 [Asparagus officinalis]
MVVVISSPIPRPFHSPSLQSPRNPRSLPFFEKGPVGFRSTLRQRGLASMVLPSSSSPSLKGTFDAELKSPNPGVTGESDLLIVGPGVLGRMVAEKWRQDHPDSQIYGQTMTSDRHDELIKVGIKPSLRGMLTDTRVPYVIFCAPPSRTEDYPGDISALTTGRGVCVVVVGALSESWLSVALCQIVDGEETEAEDGGEDDGLRGTDYKTSYSHELHSFLF